MYFKQKSDTLFRNYKDFGYISDNRNYSYIQKTSSKFYIGDKILSESGAIFFSVLSKKPQSINDLVVKIQDIYVDVEFDLLKNDALEFYTDLRNAGFVVSGDSVSKCEENDTKFSYKILEVASTKDQSLEVADSTIETNEFLAEYFKGEPQLLNLHIELTSKCNERCIHCYIPHENKIFNIDSAVFYDILQQSKDLNILNLTLTGGEPMLHRDFLDFLINCRKLDFSVNILSNLTLISNEIVEEMKLNSLLCVQVSLYSLNPLIHDSITQVKGSFEKTKSAIDQLIENDIPLQISCPILKQNKNCYLDVIEWGQMHKIHVTSDYGIIGQHDHKNSNLQCRLSTNETQKIIADRIKNDPTYVNKILVEQEERRYLTPENPICSICHTSICIAENGDVYPCPGWQGCVVGNVKETSLKDIWNKSEKINYLRQLKRKDFQTCLECSDKEYCTMCMVRNSNEHPSGNPLVVNQYFCDIVRLTKQLVTNNINDELN